MCQVHVYRAQQEAAALIFRESRKQPGLHYRFGENSSSDVHSLTATASTLIQLTQGEVPQQQANWAYGVFTYSKDLFHFLEPWWCTVCLPLLKAPTLKWWYQLHSMSAMSRSCLKTWNEQEKETHFHSSSGTASPWSRLQCIKNLSWKAPGEKQKQTTVLKRGKEWQVHVYKKEGIKRRALKMTEEKYEKDMWMNTEGNNENIIFKKERRRFWRK